MSHIRRDVSLASRLWLAAHRLWPSVSTQLVLEGSGTFEPSLWKSAVAVASAANPGTRMVLKGHVHFSRWVDSGVTPPVRVMSTRQWDSFGSPGSEVINHYSPRTGPMAEVILLEGEPARVLFRSHHALMDGRGTVTWAEDVFRALRGEPVADSEDRITENVLLNISSKKPTGTAGGRFIAPTGAAVGSERGIIWGHRVVSGRFSRLLPRIMILTAREAWRHGKGRVRFSVPVDLRPRRPGLKSSSNLTNAINLEVTPRSTVEALAAEITHRLEQRRDGYLSMGERMVSFMPLYLMEHLLLGFARQGFRTGGYLYSGIISNMGLFSMDAFKGGGFAARTVRSTPVCLEMVPFSLCITGVGDEVDLLVAMPKPLASNGRMEDILSRIARGLVEGGKSGSKSGTGPLDVLERNGMQ